MKKSKKGKKLFVKKETDNVQSVETNETSSTSSIVELGNRIEFEEVEKTVFSVKPALKPVNKPTPPVNDQLGQAFADENTILIKRTIRSGQSIQFDGNVVVLGDVNPGSEIIASGNIVVMGALRGVVHAGATGNEESTVAAFKLQPTQLRIANHITRAPDGDYLTPEHPEIARIKDGVVVIEVYQMGQDKQIKIC